jgi:hypothetical protein
MPDMTVTKVEANLNDQVERLVRQMNSAGTMPKDESIAATLKLGLERVRSEELKVTKETIKSGMNAGVSESIKAILAAG